MPEGSMVAIPRPSPLALAAPPSPQFSPAESEEKATATDSEPAQSPAGRPSDTPRSPEPRSAPSPGLSPLHIKSEVCSVKESPQVPAESLECAEEAGRSPAGDSDRHERATTRSEPALSLLPEAPEPRRPDSVPLQLTFDFEPPPGAVDAAPSGPPVAPDQLQLQRVRRRLEQLAGGAGPQTDPGPADTATPAAVDRRPPADAAEQWTQPAAAGPRRDRAEAEAEAEVAPLVARLRRAVAVGPPAALKALKTELVDGPGRSAELFQRVCSQMLAGGRLSLPERHVVHSVGATLLVRARAAAAWTDAHLAATALLSCRINLLQAVEPAGPVPRHCTAFRVCLTVLEALLHSGNVSDAFHFAKGYGFFPTTRRSQLSTLLPVLSELVRRLSAAGLVPAAVSLLDWLAERSERDRQLFDDDYRLLVDFERLVNVALLAALRAGRPEVALRLHTLAVDQGVCLSTESLRQTLHLRLDRRHFSHVRDLYNLGIAIGVYPHQKVFSPLQVRLPCWLSQEEMVVALEEYVRSVVADFGGVPPVQPLTVLLLAEGGPPAPLGRPLLPEDAGVRLQQACSLLVPPLRLQPGGGPLQFLVTAESLVDKLMTQAASQRGRVASAPGLVRVWDAPPGR
ncbi:uncharacterized protein LOC122388244 [Amphibalanus amphitrite]|uniref:uncharacterized protein LOC122388244 n=1 Tax=Amphibalanus amphitrite TaxID=1232801 RepID=UPI001C9101F3|nr:uncharacterized protein LOC122388244 [Amphibalanus amphitrite]XP_043236274.1 uncharacterized protein LOC122388244 [Amphibalanus amphitrite]XP_043237087.1 uncharacterized protein LOC122388244 [Amphibalanus amphitrite]